MLQAAGTSTGEVFSGTDFGLREQKRPPLDDRGSALQAVEMFDEMFYSVVSSLLRGGVLFFCILTYYIIR